MIGKTELSIDDIPDDEIRDEITTCKEAFSVLNLSIRSELILLEIDLLAGIESTSATMGWVRLTLYDEKLRI